ncbi:MAG: AmmeMemoRadiSam system protein A, partial [Lachnospiraceae bacterium]|nr:AmmeMemoRadiSam system protein A [Lachnospiraceae bacterium]
PEVNFHMEYDEEFVDALTARASERSFPAGTLGERKRELDHGTMVPLWFILKKYKDFKLVRTGLSGLDLMKHYEFGMLLKETADALGRRVVYVASGDLSHKLQSYGPYGFAEEGPVYDRRIMETCGSARFGELFDFDETFCEKAAECGHRSFVIMAGALDGMAVEATQLSHEDVTGVGYGICTFYPQGADEGRHFLAQRLQIETKRLEEKRAQSDAYVRLARASAEHFVRTGRLLKMPDWVPEELLKAKAGAFVSVHEHGKLRGCIGTISPVRASLAEEILRNAVSAVSEDPRFDRVMEEELPWLEISVDVLREAEPVESEADLDPKKYGVIVQSGLRRGLLLPDLDGVDTVKQQISICRQKGGISANAPVKLFRFEVIRHY